jgi:hypothetical protein
VSEVGGNVVSMFTGKSQDAPACGWGGMASGGLGAGGVYGRGGLGGPPPPQAFSLEEAPTCGRGSSLRALVKR